MIKTYHETCVFGAVVTVGSKNNPIQQEICGLDCGAGGYYISLGIDPDCNYCDGYTPKKEMK